MKSGCPWREHSEGVNPTLSALMEVAAGKFMRQHRVQMGGDGCEVPLPVWRHHSERGTCWSCSSASFLRVTTRSCSFAALFHLLPSFPSAGAHGDQGSQPTGWKPRLWVAPGCEGDTRHVPGCWMAGTRRGAGDGRHSLDSCE